MLKFHQINEKAGDTAIFTFGRFNPPTTGHEKLIDALAREQSKNSGSKMYVFPSQSQNPKKDPLPFALKVAYMRKMFPKYAKNILANKKVRMVFDIAVDLHNKGHRSIVMVVGSDRVAEFDGLLNKYNGVNGRHGYYGFDNIEVVSAGERDPDAEGVSGMSASKMRAAASDGDFDSFKTGVPSGFKDALKLYNDVRKNMGIREEKDMGEMTDFETLRDLYLTGKLWNIGDIVEAKGVSGKVINKGTNYLSFVDENNKVHKTWLYDIVERDYKKEYANYQGTPEQIARRSSRNKARRVMGDKVVKGMDVGHKDNNPMNNDPSNLRNEDPSVNRKEPRLREVKQDKDIKSRDGTQPAKYYAKDTEGDAMSKSTKQARARHFDKKKSGPAPGDASATTKPSKHTKKFKQMYGEELPKDADMGDYIDDFAKSDAPQFKGKSKKKRKDMAIAAYLDKNESVLDKVNTLLSEDGHTDVASMKNKVKIAMSALQKMQSELGKLGDESDLPTWWTNKVSTAVSRLDDMSDYLDAQVEELQMEFYQLDEKIEGLVTKAKKSGMPYGILKKVYDRGMAAYKTGHRPGTTAQQWAFARVNSFVTKSSGTWGKADKDLADKVRASEEVEVQETELGMIPKKKRKGHEVLGPESVQEWFESNMTRASYQLRHGEDWWWKLQEVKEAMLEKTGACCDDCGEELNEKYADFIRLTFNSPADVKKAKKWMDENLPSANQGFTGVDYSNKDIEFEDVDDADGLMSKLKRAGFRFKIDHREEVNEEVLPGHKVQSVEYKFKNKNEAMKAKEMLLKSFNEVDDEDINRGVIIVDAGRRDMNKEHKEIMKKFRPKVLSGRKIDRKGNVLDMKEETELKEKGPCWDGFKQVGMKMKGGKQVPNCVPESWTQEDIDENLRKVKGTSNLYEPKKMTKFARTKSMMDYLGQRDKKAAEKRKKDKTTSDYKMKMYNSMENAWGEVTEKDDKSGKELNNPTRGDVKKYKVYVKNDKGNVVKVEFGDPNMSIKRDDPEARKNFRARHNCDQKKDKTTAGYWSCKFWSTKSVTDLMKG